MTYTTLNNSPIALSSKAGFQPTLEDVRRSGAAINAVDKVMYTIEVQGEVKAAPITDDLIEELTGIRAGITGGLKYIRLPDLPYTLVRMDDIGTIVEPGDKIKLPYGVFPQVAFISNNDTIAILADLPEKEFEAAHVQRWPSPLDELENPTALSEVWADMVQDEETDPVSE